MNRRMQKKKDREQQRQAAIQQFVKRCEALYEQKRVRREL